MKKTHSGIANRTLILLGIMLGIECFGSTRVPTHVQMTRIENAIIAYRTQKGEFPTSIDELVNDASLLITKKDLVDFWGEPIGYEHRGDEYIVWSTGPDKKLGTKDDVVRGSLPSYVEIWKAKHAQPADGQGTDAVQGAAQTGGAQTSPPSHEKPTSTAKAKTPGNVVEEEQSKTNPWLYVGIAVCFLCAIFHFLRRKLEAGN
jgi:hypothetical protein